MAFSPEFKKQLVEVSGIKVNPEIADQLLGIKEGIYRTLSVGNTQLTRERFEKVFSIVLRKCSKEDVLKSNKAGLVRDVVQELENERQFPDSDFKKSAPESKTAETIKIRQKKERYPYEYPERLEEDKQKDKKKEKIMPKIIRGSVHIDDFLRWVQHVAESKGIPFDIVAIKKLLMTSKRYLALFTDKQTGMMNPMILSLVEELIRA